MLMAEIKAMTGFVTIPNSTLIRDRWKPNNDKAFSHFNNSVEIFLGVGKSTQKSDISAVVKSEKIEINRTGDNMIVFGSIDKYEEMLINRELIDSTEPEDLHDLTIDGIIDKNSEKNRTKEKGNLKWHINKQKYPKRNGCGFVATA